jgi:hypothetical protein
VQFAISKHEALNLLAVAARLEDSVAAQRAIGFSRAAKTIQDLVGRVREVAKREPVPVSKPGATVKATQIPNEWMPDCEMKRIICHWTAGSYEASDHDHECYHLLIEKDGTLVRGELSIADNVSTADEIYAHHTKGCNTKSIGIAVCCMANACERPFDPGPCPMTKEQWELLAQVAAQLAKRYRIPVTPKTVLGHGEVGQQLNIKQNEKWDPMVLPWDPFATKEKVGNLFRARVSAILAKG